MKDDDLKSSVRTNCKNCAFAVYDDITQVGCEHNRILKFGQCVKEAYDEEREFYIVERLCNYYRDKSWGYSSTDLEKVRLESANSYSVFIDCNALDESQKLNDFISQINYYPEKLSINLFHSEENFKRVKDCVSSVARMNNNIGISVISNTVDDYLHRSIKKTRTSFHCVISTIDKEEAGFATDIEGLINDRLIKAYVVRYNNIVLFNNYVYKAISHINQLYTYKDTVKKLIEDSKKLDAYIEL